MHNTVKKTGYIVAVLAAFMLILAAVPLTAQEMPAPQQNQEMPEPDFSDAEIESFAAALVDIETIQSGMQEEMDGIIAESDMESDRFYELHSQYTQSQGELPEDVSDSEQEAFQTTFQELVAAEQEIQTEMIEAVEEAGLDVETFNSIVAVAQQNPDLWNEIQSHQEQE